MNTKPKKFSVTRGIVIFLLIASWIFQYPPVFRWPQLPLTDFPPEIEKAEAATFGDGILLYGASGNTNPQQRVYTNSTNAFGSNSNTVAGSQPNIVVLKSSPTRNEMVAGYIDSSSNLQVMCFNGTSWTNEWSVAVGSATIRRFNIAYETNSGDVMVLYSRNATTTNEMAYRTKPGTSTCGSANWVAATNLDATGTSGVVEWIELDSDVRSTSNRLAAAWSDANRDLGVRVWTGSTWENEPTARETNLDIIAAAGDVDNFELKFEASTGEPMVVWGRSVTSNTNGAFYSTCTGADPCSWSPAAAVATVTDRIHWIEMAADPLTDDLVYTAIGEAGSSDDMTAAYWSGSAWTGSVNLDNSAENMATGAGQNAVAASFITGGSTTRCIIQYDDASGNGISWKHAVPPCSSWTSPSDQAVTPGLNDIRDQYQSSQNPHDLSEVMVMISDNTSGIFAKRLTLADDGTTFTWTEPDGQASLSTVNSRPRKGFAFAYNNFIDQLPAAPTRHDIPFRAQETPDSTPDFEFTGSDPDGAAGIIYQVQVATATTFASPLIDCASDSSCTAGAGYFVNTASSTDTSPFTENERIRFTASTTLPNNASDTAYYWRVRAKDSNVEGGSGSYGAYTATLSFRVDTGLSQSQWVQTTDNQFLQNLLSGTKVDTGNHRVRLSPSGISTYVLDGDSHFAYDNDELDAGEGVPPGDWTNIGTIGDSCVPPNADSDEVSTVSATAYDDMSSDNDVAYTSRGSPGDNSCIGTNWVVSENPSLISAIDISANSWLQKSGNVRFYAKNWSSGNYDHLAAVNITSTASPGQNSTTTISSGFPNYIDVDGNLRLVFIVEGTNSDWSVDRMELQVNSSAATTGTMRGRPVNFNWVSGQAVWDNLTWTENETNGSVSMQVWYTTSTTSTICSAAIPDGDLEGNASGFASGPVDLTGLSTSTYSRICARATLTDSGGTPYLNDWTIKWSPTVPTILKQANYRWYYNQASSTPSSTALAVQNATATGVAANDIVRLRMNIGATNAASTAGKTYKLQYSTSTSGGWADVGGTASTTIWRGYDNAGVSDGVTIPVLLLPSSTVAQTYEEQNNSASTPNDIPAGDWGEWDWVIQNNGAAFSTTYYFWMIYSSGTAFYSYTRYPALVTAAQPPVSISQRQGVIENDEDIGSTTISTSTLIKIGQRLRVKIQLDTGSGVSINKVFKLQYDKNDSNWQDVKPSTEIKPALSTVIKGKMTLGGPEAGTCQGGTTWKKGTIYEGRVITDSENMESNACKEFAFIIHTASSSADTTYRFRLFDVITSSTLSYAGYPQFTTVSSGNDIGLYSKANLQLLPSGASSTAYDDLRFLLDGFGYTNVNADDTAREILKNVTTIDAGVDTILNSETENSANFGISVASAGDVNGDGYTDVIVGAYGHDNGGAANANRGRAYIFFGGSSMDATPDVTLNSETESSAYFGISVASAGDVNGDGYADVIVGAYGHGNGGTDRGRAYIFFGGSSMDATPDVTLNSETEDEAYFGTSVASAGDVNGDGYTDVIVGANDHDNGGAANANRGRAYIFYGGSSMDATPDVTLNSETESSAYFGISVASAGDVNADGYADVIVGAYLHDNGGGAGADRGRAYLIFGGANSNGAYPTFLFANKSTSTACASITEISASWKGQSSIAASNRAIFLQAYRFGSTNNWETAASTTSFTADTDGTLSTTINTDANEYCDATNDSSYWRVYQDIASSTLRTNQWNINFAAGVLNPQISAAANQTFAVSDAITPISPITVTSTAASQITAADDIRISISTSTTNFRWDANDTLATITGSASSKATTTVSYEEVAGSVAAILVVNVTSDFSNGESITISDLGYRDFNTVNSATSTRKMRWQGQAQPPPFANDNKTVAIKGRLNAQDHSNGQKTDQFAASSTAANKELFAFQLNPPDEAASTTLTIDLSSITGIITSDLTEARIFVDTNINGTIDAGETTTAFGNGTVNIAGGNGTITFTGTTSTVPTATSTRYILKATTTNLLAGDTITFSLATSSINSDGQTSKIRLAANGTPSNVQHTVDASSRTQRSFRWQNDDGGVNSNTNMNTADASVSNVKIGQRLTLRTQADNDGGGDSGKTYKLQFQANGTSSSWSDVAAGTAIQYSEGLAGSNGASITSAVGSANARNFTSGVWTEGTGISNSQTLLNNQYTELAYMIDTANASANTTYYFRIYNNTDNQPIDGHPIYPSLTTVTNASNTLQYSKDAVGSLSTNTSSLTYFFDNADYVSSTASDNDRSSISASANRPVFNFRVRNSTSSHPLRATWEGQVSASAATTLETYRFGSTNAWGTIQSSSTPVTGNDFTLFGNLTSAISEYYEQDGSNFWSYFRTQMASVTGNLLTDLFRIEFLPLTNSDADQTFEVGESPSGISQIRVKSSPDTPVITAANDIRIKIPASLNMTWQTSTLTASLGGSASSKATTTVSYPNDKTLLINVTSDFAADDDLTISGLSFNGFSSANATSTLEAYYDGASDSTADALDTRSKKIRGKYEIADPTSQEGNVLEDAVANKTDAELLSFILTPTGESATTTQIVINLFDMQGFTTNDVTSTLLYVDSDGNGNIGAGETQTLGGPGVVSITGPNGTITFSQSFTVTSTLNLILKGDLLNLESSDTIKFRITPSGITASGQTSKIALVPSGTSPAAAHAKPSKEGGGRPSEGGGGPPGGLRGGGGQHGGSPPTEGGSGGGETQTGGDEGGGGSSPPPSP